VRAWALARTLGDRPRVMLLDEAVARSIQTKLVLESDMAAASGPKVATSADHDTSRGGGLMVGPRDVLTTVRPASKGSTRLHLDC